MIHKYQDTDLNDLLNAWYIASQVAHHFLDEDFLRTERENIKSIYLPVAETWVYKKDGKVVGFISLLENEVGGLFVHADHQRQGIGRQLMDFAIERKGTLTLEVFEENEISRAFYQKYGFMEIEQYFDDETQRNQIRMTLN